jgi:hypothetical protein
MTKRQKRIRLNLIALCAEGALEPDLVTPVDEVIADAKRARAAAVGRWVAYHRGLQGSDRERYGRR